MPYLSALIDRTTIRRSPVALNDIRERILDYDAVGAEIATAVPCRLVFGEPRVVEAVFGKSLECDAIVYLGAGVDVKPDALDTDGQSDLLTITQKKGGVVSKWFVVASKNAAQAGRGIVAAVRRWSQ